MQTHLTIPANLAEISAFTPKLESQLQHLVVEVRTTVTLAVHELLVNIVEHGYMDEAGKIDLTITHTSIDLSIVVTDQAKTAFEMPDQIDAPDPVDLPEGGMGMFIIHQAFDAVKYERLEQGNRWTLVKTLGGA